MGRLKNNQKFNLSKIFFYKFVNLKSKVSPTKNIKKGIKFSHNLIKHKKDLNIIKLQLNK
jgi:hypothetical protein